jgi:DNA processing protein
MAKPGSILLNLVRTIDPKKIEAILSSLGDTDKLLDVSAKQLAQIPLLDHKDRQAIEEVRADALEKEIKLIKQEGLTVLDIFDKNYPVLLKEIASQPLVLYVKGNVQALNEYLFAIVGSRIPTIYGLSMAQDFAARLASLGMVIVSGLARGIDTCAHKGALKTGKTLAVLGSGLLNIYPRENKKLSEEIIKKGALVSEFPLHTPPFKENFPRRNRIVSGLSHAVFVVEAASRSGALITAGYALEQNREVFALPGPADSALSRGSHMLIKQGAKLVDCAADILEELNLKFEETAPAQNISLSTQQKLIFDMLNKGGLFLEEIIARSGLPFAHVNKIIIDLQLAGLIKELKPSYFVK